MKAMVYERYGGPEVLALRDVPEPQMGANELLIRVRAASINRSDWEALTARPAYVRLSGSGFRRPKAQILGTDIAGIVEAAGPEVTAFKPGDDVLGDIIWAGGKAFAEYVVVKASAPLALKPAGVTFEQAAAIPQGGGLANQGLNHRRPTRPGDRVLIVGAGGGGGSFAVQLARAAGAEVTGVDSGGKLDFMRSLGADHVLDYAREDHTASGSRYDRILDFAGSRSVFANRRALADRGVYAMVGGSVPQLVQLVTLGWALSKFSNLDLSLLMAKPNSEELTHLVGLVESGGLTPAIDQVYDLAALPEAMERLGSGEVKGKLVITI